MAKANNNDMDDLHATVAKELKKLITKKRTDEDGNEIECPAQYINIARQFLKDNNITISNPTVPPDFLAPEDLPFQNSLNTGEELMGYPERDKGNLH